MSNITNDCFMSDNVIQMQKGLYFISYYVLTPIYFFIGLIGNSLLLAAFTKQAKSENAYMYQILITISKTLEIITFTMFVAANKWWSGLQNEGAQWFKQIFALMWFTAHGAAPLVNGMLTTTLLLSVAMAADRVAALSRPLKYKSRNHRLDHILTGSICFVIGMGTTIFDCFRFLILVNGDAYVLVVDQIYVGSTISLVLSQLRTVLRIVALAILITLNFVMVLIFRRRSKKVAQMANSEQKEQARKNADKTLLMLTVWQCLLTCLAEIPLILGYIMIYVVPNWSVCGGKIMGPLNDGALAIADAADFFVVFSINKKSKQMLKSVLPRYRCSCQRIEDVSNILPGASVSGISSSRRSQSVRKV